jgi:hypothetical protein
LKKYKYIHNKYKLIFIHIYAPKKKKKTYKNKLLNVEFFTIKSKGISSPLKQITPALPVAQHDVNVECSIIQVPFELK